MSAPWPTVKLGEVVDSVQRPEVPIPGTNYRQIGVRLWGEGAYEREPIDGAETRYAQLYRAETDDVIVNKIWARNGSVAVVHASLAGTYGSGEFPMFSPHRASLDPRWIHWLTKTRGFWEQCDEKSRGTSGQNRIRPERFLEIEIPLPPLPEQRRIVGKIEELAAQIEDALALRSEAETERSVLWSSILQHTLLGANSAPCEGDMAAEEMLASAAKRYARTPISIHNNATPNRPAFMPTGPAPLPSGWAWTTLGSVLTHLIDCVNDTPDFSEESTGLLGLKSTNIRPYKLDLNQRWYMTRSDFDRWNRREKPEAGDIILTREAPMGNACILPDGVEVCLTQRLLLLRANVEVIEPDLLLHYLNSSIFQEQVRDQCRGLTTPHIRVQDAPGFLLPLPPKQRQAEIVHDLRDIKTGLDDLKGAQAHLGEELRALLPSILDHAFRGEL